MSASLTPRPGTGGRPLAAFLGCATIWGSTFLAIRFGNDALPPLWAASLRLALAALLLAMLARVTRQPLPRGRALRAAAQFGFLIGSQLSLLYWGELFVPSGVTAVMFATVPLTTALAARAVGLERPSPLKLLAASVALIGVAVLFSSELARAVPFVPLLAVLVASICGAFSGIALKLGPRQNSLGVNCVGSVVGFAVCLTASILRRESHPLPTTAAALVPLAYLTVVGSIGALVLYVWLLNQWPISRISFIAVIVPVIATTLGLVIRHEALRAMSVVGSLLVISAVFLALATDRPSGETH